MKKLIESKWEDILYLLETQYDVSKIIIDTWIRSIKVYEVRNNTIYFFVDEQRGKFGVDYLHKKGYDIFLLSSIREILNNADIEIVIDEKSNLAKTFNKEDSQENEDASYSKAYRDAIRRSNLNPKYTFDNFIVGDSNRHAYATCLAVADLPSQDNFNPLFIYGGSGLGKTHLMQSIAHYILQHDDEANVLYVSSETFTNEIIDAIQKNKTEEFRAKYRQVDVLLIDDIQEIIGRERTQQEFFNTFNFLYEAKKQIILSSDKPPKEIKSLEERIRSRFEWGVPIDIHAPDYETRMAILKNKAEMDNLTNISDDVFKYIAENIVSNVRELEGALNKISVYSKLINVDITVDLAKDTLKDLISKDSNTSITGELILNTVAEHLNISTEDICSKKRSQDIAIARQIVMYLCRNYTAKTLHSIGDIVGGKNHATVMSGIKNVKKKMEEDEEFNAMIQIIIKKINPQDK